MGIEFGKGDDRIYIFRHSVGALVAVGDGIADRQPAAVDQNEIDAPRVDAYGLGDFPDVGRRFAAHEHVPRQRLDIPAVVAVFDDLRVVETVYLFESYLAVLDPTEDVAPRRRSDIYRQMLSHSFFLSGAVSPNAECARL